MSELETLITKHDNEIFNQAIDVAIDVAIATVKQYFCDAIDDGADVFSKDDKDILTYNKHICERLKAIKKV